MKKELPCFLWRVEKSWRDWKFFLLRAKITKIALARLRGTIPFLPSTADLNRVGVFRRLNERSSSRHCFFVPTVCSNGRESDKVLT